jgi:hypothetical protein
MALDGTGRRRRREAERLALPLELVDNGRRRQLLTTMINHRQSMTTIGIDWHQLASISDLGDRQ